MSFHVKRENKSKEERPRGGRSSFDYFIFAPSCVSTG